MNRKILHIAIFILFGSKALFAQTASDSILVEEQLTDSLLSDVDYAMMRHEKVSILFKAGIVPIQFNHDESTSYNSWLEAEFSLFTGLSFNAGVNYQLRLREFDENYDFTSSSQWDVFGEFRWYYLIANRVRKRSYAPNFSDQYVSLGAEYRNDIAKNNNLGFYAKWGFQTRYKKHAYVDFGLKAGYNIPYDEAIESSFKMQSYMRLGLDFSTRKEQLDKKRLCGVENCSTTRTWLLKVNLLNALYADYNEVFSFNINPNISFEKKLGKSPWSILAGLDANIRFSESSYEYSEDFERFYLSKEINSSLKTELELRLYYNLIQRMRKNKTGGALSGNYFGLGYSLSFVELDRYTWSSGTAMYKRNNFHFTTGFQRLISKHFYTDIALRLNISDRSWFRGGSKDGVNDNKANLDFKIAFGYRF